MFGVSILKEDELVTADEEIRLFLCFSSFFGLFKLASFPYIFHLKAQSGPFGTIKFTQFIVINVHLAVWRNKQLQIAVLIHSQVAKMQLSLETCLAETLQCAGELSQKLF